MSKEATTSMRFRWASSDRYHLLKDFARQNRQNGTLAEDILWQHIRSKSLGFEIRRQHIIADFIADFVCLDKMLIIEVDGGYHSERTQIEDDTLRTEQLNSLGFRVIRFQNEDILYNIDSVLQEILNALRK